MSLNVQTFPKCYSLLVSAGTTYGGAALTTFPSPCYAISIMNDTGVNINCRLNGDANATFELAANSSFNTHFGDMVLTSVDFANPFNSGSINIQIVAGLGNF
jgi:hypothetical protein